MSASSFPRIPRPALPAEHPDGDAHDHPDLERRRRAAMHPRVAPLSGQPSDAGAPSAHRERGSGKASQLR